MFRVPSHAHNLGFHHGGGFLHKKIANDDAAIIITETVNNSLPVSFDIVRRYRKLLFNDYLLKVISNFQNDGVEGATVDLFVSVDALLGDGDATCHGSG